MKCFNFFKYLIFGLFCVCYGSIQNNEYAAKSFVGEEFLLKDDQPKNLLSLSTSAKPKEEEKEGGSIKTLTLIICGITVVYWFITLIVSFILCMKYMGSQKKRAIPPPKEELSNVEYEEFSEVPDEANILEKNSKIQGFKNKMGRAVKKGGGKKQETSDKDEFAI